MDSLRPSPVRSHPAASDQTDERGRRYRLEDHRTRLLPGMEEARVGATGGCIPAPRAACISIEVIQEVRHR